jgi:hypothetical protein
MVVPTSTWLVLRKPVPVTVSVRVGEPAEALAGLMEETAGVTVVDPPVPDPDEPVPEPDEPEPETGPVPHPFKVVNPRVTAKARRGKVQGCNLRGELVLSKQSFFLNLKLHHPQG